MGLSGNAARAGAELLITRRGARLWQSGHVVSEILARPGPTHSLFDVLAACAVVLAPGPRLAMLGFGGGSLVAPLRALGWGQAIDAVDLCGTSERAFRRICRGWAGDVRVSIAEASAWLRRRRGRFDVIVEDLSIPVPGDLVMPSVCFDPLPRLIARRLRPGGIVVINVFSPGRGGWRPVLDRLRAPLGASCVIRLHDFDHQILVASEALPHPSALSRRLRRALRHLRSRTAGRFTLHALPRRGSRAARRRSGQGGECG
jgi:SAM-dependent methyltransferase